MRKMETYKFNTKINPGLFATLFIACLILLAPFGETLNYLDFEIESFENIIDLENEVKDQEKLQNLVLEDFLPNQLYGFNVCTTTKGINEDLSVTVLRGLYFKIPTPPPDLL